LRIDPGALIQIANFIIQVRQSEIHSPVVDVHPGLVGLTELLLKRPTSDFASKLPRLSV